MKITCFKHNHWKNNSLDNLCNFSNPRFMLGIKNTKQLNRLETIRVLNIYAKRGGICY